MAKYYLRPIGDETQFSDAADYLEKPEDREGFEWVVGEPPKEAKALQIKNRRQKLDDFFNSKLAQHFNSLSDEQLGDIQLTSAAVTDLFERKEGKIPDAMLKRMVRGTILRAKSFPASLQTVKDEIVTFADSLFA